MDEVADEAKDKMNDAENGVKNKLNEASEDVSNFCDYSVVKVK